jgi:hypothetical protein
MRRAILLVILHATIIGISFARTHGKPDTSQKPVPENRVEGSVTVEGKTFKLSHVYAKLADRPNDKNRSLVLWPYQ